MKLAILPAALAYSPIRRGYGLADLANRAMLWPHGRRSPGYVYVLWYGYTCTARSVRRYGAGFS